MNRRHFLRSFGLAGAGLAAHSMISPLVRTLRANETNVPRRLVIFFSPLGTIREAWLPSGGETNFTFGPILEPLAGVESDLIICDGIAQQPEIYAAANHQEMGGILTGKRVLGANETSSHAHISVDQFIAGHDSITGGTAFRSLELAAWQGRYNYFLPQTDHMYMSARGPNQAVVPEGLPQAAFDKVFGGFTNPNDGGAGERLRARRRSVLDAVTGDLQGLQSRLGTTSTEKAKIDQHLTSMRELELRLIDTPFTCDTGDRPAEFGIDDDATLDQRFRLQLDLAINAMACDRTRIVALTGEGGRSGARHPWLGSDVRFHEVTHEPHSEDQIAICRWYAGEFRHLIDRLRSIPEAGGTMLDHTCVAWVTEQGARSASTKHSRVNMPFILAGKAGGLLSPGRFLDFSGYQSNSFLISLMNAMGLPGDSFGDVQAPPLPGLA